MLELFRTTLVSCLVSVAEEGLAGLSLPCPNCCCEPGDGRETERFGEFPPDRHQCATVCIEALRGAFADFRIRQIEEFQGEKALICTCFGVSEETIESHIRKCRLETVDEVARACNAGSGCGSCRMLIQEIIDAYQGE